MTGNALIFRETKRTDGTIIRAVFEVKEGVETKVADDFNGDLMDFRTPAQIFSDVREKACLNECEDCVAICALTGLRYRDGALIGTEPTPAPPWLMNMLLRAHEIHSIIADNNRAYAEACAAAQDWLDTPRQRSNELLFMWLSEPEPTEADIAAVEIAQARKSVYDSYSIGETNIMPLYGRVPSDAELCQFLDNRMMLINDLADDLFFTFDISIERAKILIASALRRGVLEFSGSAWRFFAECSPEEWFNWKNYRHDSFIGSLMHVGATRQIDPNWLERMAERQAQRDDTAEPFAPHKPDEGWFQHRLEAAKQASEFAKRNAADYLASTEDAAQAWLQQMMQAEPETRPEQPPPPWAQPPKPKRGRPKGSKNKPKGRS